VFVGRDENGKARFAAMRGTMGDFKRDANGSDKRFGFCMPPDNPESVTVTVFESPIDCLSHKVIEPDFDGWRLSLGGTSLSALTNFIERHSGTKKIIAATDNDEAGEQSAARILELAGARRLEATRDYPPLGKDWNETLQKIIKEVKPLEDVRKDIRFINSDYKTLFTIKDGESIKFTSGYDGEESVKKCRWIDEAHTEIGRETYHNCHWAEICERNGHSFAPADKRENKIAILAAKYGEDLTAAAVPMTEAAIKKLVGGVYTTETLYNWDKQYIFGALVRGKDGIAVCGLGGDNNGTLTSLHPYHAQHFMRELSPAQRTEPKEETLLGEVAEAKSNVASRNVADRDTPNKKTEAR
jgi:hypothetical protein